jgi:hypothetical protein
LTVQQFSIDLSAAVRQSAVACSRQRDPDERLRSASTQLEPPVDIRQRRPQSGLQFR